MSGQSSQRRRSVPFYVRALPPGYILKNLREPDFLPDVWRALQPVPSGSTRVDRAWLASRSAVKNIEGILSMLAGSISSVMRYGEDVVITPELLCHPPPVCLKLDEDKIKGNRHLLRAAPDRIRPNWGYVRIELYRQDGNTAFVSAHRFVLWAMEGMPEDSNSKDVVMHSCNDSACVSHRHLKWGTYYTNHRKRKVLSTRDD